MPNNSSDCGENATPQTVPQEESSRFTIFDTMFNLAGLVMYIADVVTDLTVGVQYLRQGDILWSAMTFVFVLLPSVVLQCFSFRWYISDQKPRHQMNGCVERIKSCTWQWLLTHILQLGAIKRYWRLLRLGLQSRKEKNYFKDVLREDRDITMLNLLESFLESAPQLVLQVYIMVESEELYWLTAASAIVSLGSLAYSLEAYHKALRKSLPSKGNITYYGLVLRMAWRLFTITARVIAMVLFASIYEWWIFVIASAHWAIMTLWILWQETDFCDNKFEEALFDAVMGVVHIFCFFNLKDGRSRHRALTFYTIIFIENTMMVGMWYLDQESQEKQYGIPALAFVWGGFFIGIFFMSLYYRCCHPKGKLPLCLLEDTRSNGDSSNDCTDGPSSEGSTADGTNLRYMNRDDTRIPRSTRHPKYLRLFSYEGRREIERTVSNNNEDRTLNLHI